MDDSLAIVSLSRGEIVGSLPTDKRSTTDLATFKSPQVLQKNMGEWYTPRRRPLGRGQSFHLMVSNISRRESSDEALADIRTYLESNLEGYRYSHNTIYVRHPFSADGYLLSLNNAHKARGLKAINCRVVSARRDDAVVSHIPSICDRWSQTGQPKLSQSCEVLGPYTCKDCVKQKVRQKYTDETRGTFYDLGVNQRFLCAEKKQKELVYQPLYKDQCRNLGYKYRRDALNASSKDLEMTHFAAATQLDLDYNIVTEAELQFRAMENARNKPRVEISRSAVRQVAPLVARIGKSTKLKKELQSVTENTRNRLIRMF